MKAAFANPKTAEEREIQAFIEAHRAAESTCWEQELFAQKTCLNEAERKLQTKETKAARESVQIATSKISRA